jgi:hypothetical protein
VADFNRRLRAGGLPEDYVFSASYIPSWLPSTDHAPVCNELYLALEDQTVRGAYALKRQNFSFRGVIRPVTFYHHPFSEGLLDRKYAPVGLQMLMQVMRAHPLLYLLGMGGYDRPLPRMMIALKWHHKLIPFWFRVNHTGQFLRKMQALRQSGAKRALADLAAFTGAGWIGIRAVQAISGLRGSRVRVEATEVEEFEDWADGIWQSCGSEYAMIAVRDTPTLRVLYPKSNPRFIRLKVARGGRLVGWAVVAIRQEANHPQYRDLRVGHILDVLASAEDTTPVIAAATRALSERDVDLIVANQSHVAWVQGMKDCGFLSGPSNFIFAASNQLAALMQPFDQAVSLSHLTRGDGDTLAQFS